jgi:hypothetical protein
MTEMDPRDVRRATREAAARDNQRDTDQQLVDDLWELLDKHDK